MTASCCGHSPRDLKKKQTSLSSTKTLPYPRPKPSCFPPVYVNKHQVLLSQYSIPIRVSRAPAVLQEPCQLTRGQLTASHLVPRHTLIPLLCSFHTWRLKTRLRFLSLWQHRQACHSNHFHLIAMLATSGWKFKVHVFRLQFFKKRRTQLQSGLWITQYSKVFSQASSHLRQAFIANQAKQTYQATVLKYPGKLDSSLP